MARAVPVRMMAVVERQMRRWELSFEVHERIEKEQAATQIPRQVCPYVSMARERGAGGSEVARFVSEKLGVELLDRELLNYMAERYNLSTGLLELVDEEDCNWLGEVFTHWFTQRSLPQLEYVRRLGQVVLLTARSGSAVFVGRGAHHLLPREKGLAVWIIAPVKQRLERVMQIHGGSAESARRYVEETDRTRRDFIQRYFHHDATDPHEYDLVLNTQELGYEDAAAVIVDAFERRFGGPVDLEPKR